MRIPSLIRLSFPALALAALALLPFWNKAYTVDDTLFLRQAENLLRDPLHPTAFEYIWRTMPERVSTIMPSGPTMAWLLFPVVVTGGSERVAHVLMLLLLGVAVVATVGIAKRLQMNDGAARLAGLILACSPAVLALSSTCMPDLPSLSFGVLAVWRWLAWQDAGRPRDMLFCALCLALAVLARSHLVLLWPAAALLVLLRTDWQAVRGGRQRARELLRQSLPVWFGLVILLGVTRLTRDPLAAGKSIFEAAASMAGLQTTVRNSVSWLSHWVLTLPLAIGWLCVRARSPRYWLGLMLCLAVVGWFRIALGLHLVPQPGSLHLPIPPMWLAVGITGLAAHALLDLGVLACGVRPPAGHSWFSPPPSPIHQNDAANDPAEEGQLAQPQTPRPLWPVACVAWLFVSLPVAVYIHLPCKYLLPSAPAAALLLAPGLATLWRTHLGRVAVCAVLAAGLGFGVVLVDTDAQFAHLGRRAATELIAPQVQAGLKVWFGGNWGFQWYAEHAGARALTGRGLLPRPGDRVVASDITVERILDHSVPRRRALGGLAETRPGGRLMNRAAGAGFYSNIWGYWPWVYSTLPLDRFTLWAVE